MYSDKGVVGLLCIHLSSIGLLACKVSGIGLLNSKVETKAWEFGCAAVHGKHVVTRVL